MITAAPTLAAPIPAATLSLLGQPPEYVQAFLGQPCHYQANPENQTDLYVYGVDFLAGVFPITPSGIIGVFRQQQCVALKVVLPKDDQGLVGFTYSQEMASRLHERITRQQQAVWIPLESESKADRLHQVYGVGYHTATTWEEVATTHRLASDVSIYLDARCAAPDPSPLRQPIVAIAGQMAGKPALAPTPPMATPPMATPPAITFSDVANHPYAAAIAAAANPLGLVSGYDDGTFRPSAPLTRRQGVVMILRSLRAGLAPARVVVPEAVTASPFADVPVDHPAAAEFYVAQQAGIVAADDQQRCHPEAELTRCEWSLLLRNALRFAVLEADPQADLATVLTPVATPVTFTDLDAHWGQTLIQELASYGLADPLTAEADAFGPDVPATRAYGAAMAMALVQAVGTAGRPQTFYQFPDLVANPYRAAIERGVNQYGLGTGYGDGNFHPQAPMTRQDVVTLLVDAMAQLATDPATVAVPPTLEEPPFADVASGEAAPKLAFAKQAGLISGDDLGRFNPLTPISRAGVMALIHGALTYLIEHNLGQTATLAEVMAPVESPPDLSDLADQPWAADMIQELATVGIATPLNETGTAFAPAALAQRDFATAALVRLLEATYVPLAPPVPVPPSQVSFIDIEGNPYATEILAAANTYKIVSGYEDHRFRPTAAISREQAVVILVDALARKVRHADAVVIPDELTQPPFVDVPRDRWSAAKLHFAKQAGLISGDDLDQFRPQAALSRAQLMAIVSQTLHYALWADFQVADPVLTDYVAASAPYEFQDLGDETAPSAWAIPLIDQMNALGLATPLNPEVPTVFGPEVPANRDYTVALAVRLIELPYTQDGTAEGGGFVDIAHSPYAPEILRAVNEYHLLAGTAEGYFHPAESVSREHLVAMVTATLAHGIADPAQVTIPEAVSHTRFEDVPADSAYAPAIEFVVDAGIMAGDGTGFFRPKNDLTRAELMTVAQRTLAYIVAANHGADMPLEQVMAPADMAPTFTDVAGHWGEETILAMARYGIADPAVPGGSTYLPDRPSRRDYAAAALVRLIEALGDGGTPRLEEEDPFPATIEEDLATAAVADGEDWAPAADDGAVAAAAAAAAAAAIQPGASDPDPMEPGTIETDLGLTDGDLDAPPTADELADGAMAMADPAAIEADLGFADLDLEDPTAEPLVDGADAVANDDDLGLVDVDLAEPAADADADAEMDLGDLDLDEPAADPIIETSDDDGEPGGLEFDEPAVEPALETSDAGMDLGDLDLGEPAADPFIEALPPTTDDDMGLGDLPLGEPIIEASADDMGLAGLDLDEPAADPFIETSDDDGDLGGLEFDEPAAEFPVETSDDDGALGSLEFDEPAAEPAFETSDAGMDLGDLDLDEPAAEPALETSDDDGDLGSLEFDEPAAEPAFETSDADAGLGDFDFGDLDLAAPADDPAEPVDGLDLGGFDFDLDPATPAPEADAASATPDPLADLGAAAPASADDLDLDALGLSDGDDALDDLDGLLSGAAPSPPSEADLAEDPLKLLGLDNPDADAQDDQDDEFDLFS